MKPPGTKDGPGGSDAFCLGEGSDLACLMLFDKHTALIVMSEKPFNAGPPLELLRQTFVTPNDLFFVRNHGSVPEIDPRAIGCPSAVWSSSGSPFRRTRFGIASRR